MGIHNSCISCVIAYIFILPFYTAEDYYLGLPHKLNVPYNVTQELKVSVFNEGEYQLSQMSMFLNGKEETRRWRLSNSTATFEIRLLQDSELYFVTGMGHTKVKSHMVQAIGKSNVYTYTYVLFFTILFLILLLHS